MRLRRAGHPVVELGHVARAAFQGADAFAEPAEAAALLGHGDGEQRLALLAHLGPLGHEAQPVEVHVGAAEHRGVGLAGGAVGGDVLFDRGHRQRAGRLDDAAGVDEHVLDSGADGIGVDRHEAVDQPAAGDAEGFGAHQLDGGAIGEQAHVGQRDPVAGGDRLHHRVGVVHLHPDHLHARAHRLDVVGHARDQPAAADGDEDRVQPVGAGAFADALHLAQDLHRDGALAGDHVGVVERVHEGQAALLLQHGGVLVGVGIALAVQHHVAAEAAHRVDLELRRGGGHHDDGGGAQLAGAHRHALRVVAGRGADHAAGQLLGRQVRHLVVGAAQLEAEDRLLVFALEQHRVAQPLAEVARPLQRRLDRHVVHPRIEDAGQVVGRGEGMGRKRGGRRNSGHGGGRQRHDRRLSGPGARAVRSGAIIRRQEKSPEPCG